jgi:hypothetical protein
MSHRPTRIYNVGKLKIESSNILMITQGSTSLNEDCGSKVKRLMRNYVKYFDTSRNLLNAIRASCKIHDIFDQNEPKLDRLRSI